MSQIVTKFITDLAVTTAKINAGAVTDAKVASGIDAAKLGDGSVSNTEFQRLNGLTGDVQTQLDAKADETIQIQTAANSGLAGGGDLTANRAIIVDPNNATSATVATGDLVLIADVSDSNNLKKVTAQSIADLAGAGITPRLNDFTLVAGDITNQYVDLTHVAIANSIHFIVKGGAPTVEGASHDYSVNLTGGAGGNTRITFLNDLATGGASALIATDVVQVKYMS
jgi:hypothetical protein